MIHPNGQDGEHRGGRHAACERDDCVLDGDDVVLARQARYAIDAVVLEVVKGGAEEGEDARAAAARANCAKTGLTAARWDDLGIVYEIPSIVQEPVSLFLAREIGAATSAPEDVKTAPRRRAHAVPRRAGGRRPRRTHRRRHRHRPLSARPSCWRTNAPHSREGGAPGYVILSGARRQRRWKDSHDACRPLQPSRSGRVRRYYVYMLQCFDGTFYTGVTNDLERRYNEHCFGHDPHSYTYIRRPLRLVYAGEFQGIDRAMDFEKRLERVESQQERALPAGLCARQPALAWLPGLRPPAKDSDCGCPSTSLRSAQDDTGGGGCVFAFQRCSGWSRAALIQRDHTNNASERRLT